MILWNGLNDGRYYNNLDDSLYDSTEFDDLGHAISLISPSVEFHNLGACINKYISNYLWSNLLSRNYFGNVRREVYGLR